MLNVKNIVHGMKSSLLVSLNDMESIILSGTFECDFDIVLTILLDAHFTVDVPAIPPLMALLFVSIRPTSDFCSMIQK